MSETLSRGHLWVIEEKSPRKGAWWVPVAESFRANYDAKKRMNKLAEGSEKQFRVKLYIRKP